LGEGRGKGEGREGEGRRERGEGREKGRGGRREGEEREISWTTPISEKLAPPLRMAQQLLLSHSKCSQKFEISNKVKVDD